MDVDLDIGVENERQQIIQLVLGVFSKHDLIELSGF